MHPVHPFGLLHSQMQNQNLQPKNPFLSYIHRYQRPVPGAEVSEKKSIAKKAQMKLDTWFKATSQKMASMKTENKSTSISFPSLKTEADVNLPANTVNLTEDSST